MALSSDLISQFAKVTKDDTKDKNKESTVYGTIVEYNDTLYAKLDGSDLLTPVSTTAEFKTGERVTVLLKNHSATVTGNASSPSARTGTVKEISDKVSEFGVIIADKVDTTELNAEIARIDNLYADNAVISGKLSAAEASIDTLTADNATINGKLTAQEASIGSLTADNVTINEKLTAAEASIDTLTTDNVTINEKLTAAEASIDTLTADNVSINEKLTAAEADIDDLSANKLSATDADIKYANIDFSNISMATIGTFFATAGIIKDVVVGEQKITGELVGVTIKGDLIEGNTIVADKLVIKGDDGLYYKLNTDGVTTEAEQTDYNSLNGSVIRAQSVTADKIAVTDLVAFGATIAGFKIEDNALYSGSKSSVNNTTRGIYLGKDGQIAFGDGNSYIKYYKDSDNKYKLAISAESLTFTTGKSINDMIDDKVSDIKSVDSTIVEYQAGTSGTTAPTGTWSVGIPTVPSGQYLWTRTTITYTDGSNSILYAISSKGDKGDKGDTGEQGPQGIQGEKGDTGSQGPQGIQGEKGDTGATGATGPKGDTGEQGPKGDTGAAGNGINSITYYYAVTSTQTAPSASSITSTTMPSLSSTNKYLWQKEVIDFTDSNVADKTTVVLLAVYGDKGKDGTNGTNGTNGTSVTITSTSITYQASSSGTSTPTGTWSTSVPNVSNGNYLWTKTIVNYSDGNSTTSYSVAYKGTNGTNGTNGTSSYTHIRYSVNSNGNPMVTTPTDSTLYIGIYTGTSSSAPTSYSSYTWSRYTGKDGATGAQGPKGDTGATGPKGDTGSQGPKGDTGAQGPKGDTGAAGADALTISITSSNGTVFKNNTGSTVLTAHVFKGGVEQTVASNGTVSGIGTVKWYLGSTLVSTSKSITVNASAVTNTATYTVNLE